MEEKAYTLEAAAEPEETLIYAGFKLAVPMDAGASVGGFEEENGGTLDGGGDFPVAFLCEEVFFSLT